MGRGQYGPSLKIQLRVRQCYHNIKKKKIPHKKKTKKKKNLKILVREI